MLLIFPVPSCQCANDSNATIVYAPDGLLLVRRHGPSPRFVGAADQGLRDRSPVMSILRYHQSRSNDIKTARGSGLSSTRSCLSPAFHSNSNGPNHGRRR